MTDKKKITPLSEQPFARVAHSMHGIDDTIRETIVYPNPHTVLGISEGDDFIVLHSATSDAPDEPVQVIWIDINEHNPSAAISLFGVLRNILTKHSASL